MSKLIFIIFFLLPSLVYLQAEEKMRMAVVDLQPVGVDAATAITISDLLRTEIFKTGFFTVLERKEMETLLKEQEFSMTGCTDTECAIQIGKLLTLEKVLVGTVNKLGDAYIINVRIVDVEKGVMESAEKDIVKDISELAYGCEILAKKLVKQMKGFTTETKPPVGVERIPKIEREVREPKPPVGVERIPEPKIERIEKEIKEPKRWGLDLELGAGRLFTVSGSFQNFGVSTGFDFGPIEIGQRTYSSMLLHFGLFYAINFFPESDFVLALRPKVGIDWVRLADLSSTSFQLASQLLIGYYNFYGLSSLSWLILRENVFLFQLGIGYRIRF